MFIILNMEINIASLFREARAISGKTQEEFAEYIGCSRVSISLYENGQQIPSAVKYEKARALVERHLARKADLTRKNKFTCF